MVKYMNNNSGFQQWNAAKDAAQKKSPWLGFLWWVILFVAAWWMMSWWMGPKPTQTDAENAVAVEAVDLSAVPVNEISSDNLTADVQGLRISNVELLKYASNASDNNSAPVTLLGTEGAFAEIGLLSTGTTAPTATTVWKNSDGVSTWRNSDGVSFSRTITINDYVISVTDTVKNASKKEISVAPYEE